MPWAQPNYGLKMYKKFREKHARIDRNKKYLENKEKGTTWMRHIVQWNGTVPDIPPGVEEYSDDHLVLIKAARSIALKAFNKEQKKKAEADQVREEAEEKLQEEEKKRKALLAEISRRVGLEEQQKRREEAALKQPTTSSLSHSGKRKSDNNKTKAEARVGMGQYQGTVSGPTFYSIKLPMLTCSKVTSAGNGGPRRVAAGSTKTKRTIVCVAHLSQSDLTQDSPLNRKTLIVTMTSP